MNAYEEAITGYGAASDKYLSHGWKTPLPLPYGHKYPPPENSTGNYPNADDVQLQRWADERADDNIGLRMPRFTCEEDGKEYEVVGIDVDQYDDKSGWDTIQALEKRIGDLPDTFKSSSRGESNPSGIYYYRVPAGRKWAGQVGHGVEFIQRSHRYAVVWPSVVTDKKTGRKRQYAWYSVDDGIATDLDDEIPGVWDIPDLPIAWQEKLAKGAATDREVVEADPELADMRGVREWMKKNFPGYDQDMSETMADASDPETLAAEAKGGAHEMLVSRSHHVIMLAVEGHYGCQAALESVTNAFYDEVLGAAGGDARRSQDEARREVGRAIGMEITKLKADIAAGLIEISRVGGFTAEDVDVDTSVMLQQFVTRARRVVDAAEYKDHDAGRGTMFLDAFHGEIRAVEGSKEWVWWNPTKNRLELIESHMLTSLWLQSVVSSLETAAAKAYDLADQQMENGMEDDAKKTRKEAADYDRRARAAGNRTQRISSLDEAHNLCPDPVRTENFDRNPLLLAVENGVLDFDPEVEEAEMLRAGTPDDLLLENTGVPYVRPKAWHPAWQSYLDTFLPDREYQQFVRRVLGYGLLGGNPERLIVFLQGGTSTGKSTMLDTLRAAIGSYGATVAANAMFREKQDAGPAPEMLTALPKRMVFSSEIGPNNRLHADVIKRLTGGDEVTARALYSNKMVERKPMFTPFIATNSMPTISDGDEALWRRILVLPFDHSVKQGSTPRRELKDIPGALESVLAWLVEGLLDYQQDGLAPDTWPASVVQRKRTFISGTSDFQDFCQRRLARVDDPAKGTLPSQLHQAYTTWATAEGLKDKDILSARQLGLKMSANGFERVRVAKRINGKATTVTVYKVRLKKGNA